MAAGELCMVSAAASHASRHLRRAIGPILIALLVGACSGGGAESTGEDGKASAGTEADPLLLEPIAEATPEAVAASEWDAIESTVALAAAPPLDADLLMDGWRDAATRALQSEDTLTPAAMSTVGGANQPQAVSVAYAVPAESQIAAFGGVVTMSASKAAMDGLAGREFDDGGHLKVFDGEATAEVDGLRVTRKMSKDVTLSQEGSKVKARVTFAIDYTVADAVTGVVSQRHRSQASAQFDVAFCPDPDGVATVEGEMRITEGSSASYVVSVRASGQVDDAAFLASSEVRGDVTTSGGDRSTEVVYRHTSGGGEDERIEAFVASDEIGGLSSLQRNAGGAQLVDMLSQNLLKVAETKWRNGDCLQIRSDDVQDSNTVLPDSETMFRAEVWHRFDDESVDVDIVGSLSGKQSLEPKDTQERSPVRFTYRAGPERRDEGTVTLRSTSRRGIARRDVRFTVGGGWTLANTVDRPGSPYAYSGERCDADSVEGTWMLYDKANLAGGLLDRHTTTMTLDAGGTGTWSEAGRMTGDGDVVTSISGGTLTWEELDNGDVHISLTRTQNVLVTVDGETMDMGNWEDVRFEMTWSTRGCDGP